MRHLSRGAICVAFALVVTSAAASGGSFERIVGVGAEGATRDIALARTGPRSDRSLFAGRGRTEIPRGGFVRIFPLLGGLPGVPGRYYPREHVLCFGWHDPEISCQHMNAEAERLLRPFRSLPLRDRRPTVVVRVRHRRRTLRFADGNVFAAIELALDRRASCPRQRPRRTIGLAVSWRGPAAAGRPGRVLLSPHAVYADSCLYRLPLGVWCFVVINLPERTEPPTPAEIPKICRRR